MKHRIRWTSQKIASRLKLIQNLQYRRKVPIAPFYYKALPDPETQPPLGTDMHNGNWQMIPPNSYWGTWYTDFLLRTEFTIPSDWDHGATVMLYLPLGNAGDFSHPETLAYIDGLPYASADRHHHEILLPYSVNDGKPHRLELHGWTGRGGGMGSPPKTQLFMQECFVVEVHQPTRDLIARVRGALELAQNLAAKNPVRERLLNALDDTFLVLDTRDPIGEDAFYNSVQPALDTLQRGLEAAGSPMDVHIVAIGHAHIDVAWLWQIGHTRRKTGRTFSNVLRHMEQYPDYHFSQSQPQLYKYAEELYPEIFAEIKERVTEGRWEIMGGTWVEPDCNATGAESLVRQLLLGRSYFRKHFGDVDTPVLWLPDTFGYSWALPQLIHQAGMKYFITHKMSWNQYNQMPYQLLWWQGIDGTKVLTHFLTTPEDIEGLPFSTTYNGTVSAKQIMGTWDNFTQKETHNELVTAYGYGDGGGGPTREMLENVQTFSCLAGAPQVRCGTVREFMEKVEKQVADDLPVFNGEFYLELHRGTLTSQARTKWNNRKSEFLLHDAEFVATVARLVAGYEYPYTILNEAWELICLNQFHDILPGSSITEVYEDADRDYARIRKLGEDVRDQAILALAKTLPGDAIAMAINPTSFAGDKVGILDATLSSGLAQDGKPLLTQDSADGTLVQLTNLDPYSIVSLSSAETAIMETALSVIETDDEILFENALIRVTFARNGDVTGLYDKEVGREVLAEGEVGNQLLSMEDRPLEWDAWDVDIYYDDRVEKIEGVVSLTVVETGPIRAVLEVRRAYRRSMITQKIIFYHNSKRLDFDTHVDWREQHTLLKVAFPVDILSPTATYDIQWGNVERTTHRNTSWDWARFETAAQKWADLSEGNYGIALLNDSKYGYDILDHVIRLSLLTSATEPDPVADQGEHLMRYSLLPHTGDWRNGVAAEAYDLNNPVILRSVANADGDVKVYSLVSTDQDNVIIETVKWAEDGNGLIVRLYEGERNRGKVTLRTGFDLKQAYLCNLLEENETALPIENNEITLNVRPYMIATIRLIPA